MKHLFGPVPSRRFGRSLGVDLTPFKTCTLDCVFCQLGHTTSKTCQRCEYVPLGELKKELLSWIREGGTADYISLAGSGEPTLHNGFGELIDFIHANSDIPVALLTNGTTLYSPDVRESAAKADVAKVTMSAYDQESFVRLHRPCEGVTFNKLVNGTYAFRRDFKKSLWIEVFLVEGINSDIDNVRRIAALVGSLKPDKIHLNTSVRPPSEETATAVSEERMIELASPFDMCPNVIIPKFNSISPGDELNEVDILEILRRRPCTAVQIAEAFDMHMNEVAKYISRLLYKKLIYSDDRGIGAYYSAVKSKEELVLR